MGEMYYYDDWYEVFVDGACIRNGQPGARAGIRVHFTHDEDLDVSEPLRGRATNSRAEIVALIKAVRIALREGIRKLRIITDSVYVKNCIELWMPKWEANGWRRCDGRPVVNQRDLENMRDVLDELDDYEIKHVYGHTGVRGNEKANDLAQKGAQRSNSYY